MTNNRTDEVLQIKCWLSRSNHSFNSNSKIQKILFFLAYLGWMRDPPQRLLVCVLFLNLWLAWINTIQGNISSSATVPPTILCSGWSIRRNSDSILPRVSLLLSRLSLFLSRVLLLSSAGVVRGRTMSTNRKYSIPRSRLIKNSLFSIDFFVFNWCQV